MGFNTISIHCKTIFGIEDNDEDPDILRSFNVTEDSNILYKISLTKPHCYLKNNKSTIFLYRKFTKDRIECIDFRDEPGRPLAFIGDVLSCTPHFVKKGFVI